MTYVLASNVPVIVPFIAMATAKIPPALNILQILAVDVGTDMVPALGAETPEHGTMDTPPRIKDKPLLDTRLLARSYILGCLKRGEHAGIRSGVAHPWLVVFRSSGSDFVDS